MKYSKEEFIEKCVAAFALNRLECTPEQGCALYELTDRMLTVNEHLNLTAIKDEDAIIFRHYVDSVTLAAYIPKDARMLDVGCGAGFPTLPLAIFRPDLKITALDGTAKRITYVAETARMLGLSGVRAVAARAEELAHDPKERESYDVVTARAVAALPVLSELCLPFAKVGGQMIAMKAALADEELAASENAIRLCGGSISETGSFELLSDTEEPAARRLIIIDKVKKTAPLYPRHYSKISKKPL